MYLGEPLFDRHELTVRTGGHVAVGQHARKLSRRRLKLQAQDLSKSAFASFDDGAGVMGDEPAQHGVAVLGVAQVTGAVECVQARHNKVGCVADIVQPRGSLQQIRVRAENSRQAMYLGGDTLNVRPAPGHSGERAELGIDGGDSRPLRDQARTRPPDTATQARRPSHFTSATNSSASVGSPAAAVASIGAMKP